jgi:SAM-dependent methyltransferase
MDAENMDLADDSVGGVLCRWGFMVMADPAKAFAETRRVLRPGGRLCFSVWAGPERNPWASIVGATLVEREHIPAPQPGTPGIFSLADPERIRALVTGAGFGEPQIDEFPVTWAFDSFDGYWKFVSKTAGSLALAIAALPEDEREDVRETLRERTTQFESDGSFAPSGLCWNCVAS